MKDKGIKKRVAKQIGFLSKAPIEVHHGRTKRVSGYSCSLSKANGNAKRKRF
jgi:hypothetical protein